MATAPNLGLRLERYQRFGVHLGLERVLAVLERLGNPQQRVPVIHVAGTNGKGSVCAYLSSVLAVAGYRVGCYTSPHLVDWTERICLNQRPIAAAVLDELLLDLEKTLQQTDLQPTQFEVLTAVAWQYFAQSAVDIAVIEVGLGGRLDATNVCDRPLVSVITSISREHWQRLGPTLADIAREKAGVCKSACPVIIGPLPPAAKAVVQQMIHQLDCPAYWPPAALPLQDVPETAASISRGQSMTWARAEGIVYPLALLGEMQTMNSALAIAALQELRRQGWSITDTAIQQGMAQARWPGRLQWVEWAQQPLLIDGAHNPAAAVELRRYLDSLEAHPVHWLMGMLSTKDHGDIFAALLRPGDQLSLMPVPDHDSADPQALAQLAQQVCPGLERCACLPNLETALTFAFTPKPRSDLGTPLRVLCGSLYLVGDYLRRYPAAI